MTNMKLSKKIEELLAKAGDLAEDGSVEEMNSCLSSAKTIALMSKEDISEYITGIKDIGYNAAIDLNLKWGSRLSRVGNPIGLIRLQRAEAYAETIGRDITKELEDVRAGRYYYER